MLGRANEDSGVGRPRNAGHGVWFLVGSTLTQQQRQIKVSWHTLVPLHSPLSWVYKDSLLPTNVSSGWQILGTSTMPPPPQENEGQKRKAGYKGMMVVKNPSIRPYLLGKCGIGGVPSSR